MRFLSLIHALIGLTSLCGAAPSGKIASIEGSESASTLAPARKLPDNIGLPSQLAWEAWLIIEKRPGVQSSFESAILPRRIEPKSIFVAPSRDEQSQCSDGYKRNGTGHCVQDTIKIDATLSRREFLLKRMSMFPPKVNADLSTAVDSALESAASGPVKVNLGNEDNGPLEISLVPVRPVQGSGSAKEDEALMTIYEVGNGTKSDRGEPEALLRVNSTPALPNLPVRGVVVPVAKLVNGRNQTVIDYETQVDIEILNSSGTGLKEAVKNITESKLGGDAQPTVILLLSSTRTDPSETFISSSEVTMAQQAEETTLADGALEETTTPEIEEALSTTQYPEELDSDDPTESNDEILLHGEAGMMISAGKLASSTPPASTSTETEEANVSSESSISGDMIMETTLLDLSPGTTPSHPDRDDFREIFEAEKPLEVVPSPQESLRYVSRQEDSDRSHLQQRRRTSGQNRIRFPDERLQPSGFVSFPSDHQSNSINGNLAYKGGPSFHADGPRVQSIPKNVPPGQKKTYYRLPPGWRISDPQHQAVARTGNQQLQNQMLLKRFWARMPLRRDPSLPNQSLRISTMVNNQRDNAYEDRVLGQTLRGGQVRTG